MSGPYPIALLLGQFSFGGAERQSYELMRRIDRRRFAPLAIVLSEEVEPYGPKLQAEGCEVVTLRRQGRNDLRRVLALRRMLAERRIELLYGIGYEPSAVGYFAGIGRRRPVLVPSIRSTVISPPFPKPQIYRQMFRRAPQVTSNSRRGAAFAVERFGAPADRIEVIPNGLTIEELDRQSASGTDLRSELGLGSGTPLVGFVGKDSWQKNVKRFLQVAAALREVHPEIRFVAVGWRLGPEDRDRLAAPPEVSLLGTRTDVYRLLTQFDALVMTSDTEGCPNVVIEAGILGCPVVAPDVGDVRDIFGAEAADRLVPEQAIAGYVERLARLLEKRPHDQEQTARWQQRVRREYAVETMVERTERLFTSALERKTIS